MKIKRVALLIPSIYGGGAERDILMLAGVLQQFYTVDVITLEKGAQYDPPNGVSFFHLTGIGGRSGFLLKALYFPLQRARFKRLLKEKRYDIVISYLERACFLLSSIHIKKYRSRKIFSFRVYQSLHILKEDLPFHIKVIRNTIYNRFIRRSQKHADLIVVPGKGVKDDLVHYFGLDPAGIEVVSYGYRQDLLMRMASKPMEYGINDVLERGPVITTVGRLVKQKGQWHLIRIFTELKKRLPGISLFLLGEGILHDYLVQLAMDLGNEVYSVSDVKKKAASECDIFFVGFQPNPFKYIQNSSLFALTSLWEGLANVLVEALVCGTPVVSSDCRAGPREVLAPGTDINREADEPEFAEYGVLMPVFDENFYKASEPLTITEKVWADVLCRLLEDNRLRAEYRRKAKIRSEDFSSDIFSQRWKVIVEKLLRSRTSGPS
jgi:glycosyltransferase involved in cell wall biosynthesis